VLDEPGALLVVKVEILDCSRFGVLTGKSLHISENSGTSSNQRGTPFAHGRKLRRSGKQTPSPGSYSMAVGISATGPAAPVSNAMRLFAIACGTPLRKILSGRD
jgi:hypothetical protein